MSIAPLYTQVPLRWERPRPVEVPPPPPRERDELARVRAALGEHARQLRTGRELIRSRERELRPLLPTGLAPLDALLGGGLTKGALLEIAGARTSGRWSAVLAAIAGVTSSGEAAALVDHGRHLDPQLAAAAGVELERLLWVAPESVRDCATAAEWLVAAGFPLVVVDLGVRLRGRRVPDAAWLRLARAAAAYGSALVLSAPFPLAGTAAEGSLRAASARRRWSGAGRSVPLLESIESTLTVAHHRTLREGVRCALVS